MSDQKTKSANTIPDSADGIAAIKDLAVKAAKAEIVEFSTENLADASLPKKIPLALAPNGTVVDVTAVLSAYRRHPQRVKGTAKVDTLKSFIDLVNLHRVEETVIFATTKYPNVSLTAVINYHTPGEDPGYADHRIVYPFPLTDEFKAWVACSEKSMEQAEFAAFLEEHAAELASPLDAEKSEYERLFGARFATPSDLMALSRGLEITVGQKIKSTIRLQSGERQVVFVEEHSNAKGEPVIVPGLFMVALPAFVDGDPVRVPARLRYRAGSEGVTWLYQLYRWQHWLAKAVQVDLETATKETSLPGFEGTPEA